MRTPQILVAPSALEFLRVQTQTKPTIGCQLSALVDDHIEPALRVVQAMCDEWRLAGGPNDVETRQRRAVAKSQIGVFEKNILAPANR